MRVTPSRYTLRGIPVPRDETSPAPEAVPAPRAKAGEAPTGADDRAETPRSAWLDLLRGRISLDALFGD